MFHENSTPTQKEFPQLLEEKLRVVKDLYPDKKKRTIMTDRLLNCRNEAQLENTMVWGRANLMN